MSYKKLTIGGVLLALCLFASVAFVASADATRPNPEHKVTLCHATASETNPYVSINVDWASVWTKGHDQHQDRRDIIPPFSKYAGLNWDAEGIAIWENGCTPPPPPTTTTPETTVPPTTVPPTTQPPPTITVPPTTQPECEAGCIPETTEPPVKTTEAPATTVAPAPEVIVVAPPAIQDAVVATPRFTG